MGLVLIGSKKRTREILKQTTEPQREEAEMATTTTPKNWWLITSQGMNNIKGKWKENGKGETGKRAQTLFPWINHRLL